MTRHSGLPLEPHVRLSYPMIWPEFRLHSITFATRHVVGTILALHHAWPSGLYESVLSRLFLVLLAQYAASVTTRRYGDPDARTTNSMPYPDHVSGADQLLVKRAYAVAQFGATSVAVYGDPTWRCAWLPLLAIQGAAFLMRLVRKNKISATAYHIVYASLLWINFPVFLCVFARDRCSLQIASGAMCIVATEGRLRFRVPSSLVWSVYAVATFGVYPLWSSRLASCVPALEYVFVCALVYQARRDLVVYTRLVSVRDRRRPGTCQSSADGVQSIPCRTTVLAHGE